MVITLTREQIVRALGEAVLDQLLTDDNVITLTDRSSS